MQPCQLEGAQLRSSVPVLGRFIHYLTLASVAIAFLTSCSGSGEPAESPARARDQQLKIYYLWTTEGDPHQHSSLKSGIKKALDDKILAAAGQCQPRTFARSSDSRPSHCACAQTPEQSRYARGGGTNVLRHDLGNAPNFRRRWNSRNGAQRNQPVPVFPAPRI